MTREEIEAIQKLEAEASQEPLEVYRCCFCATDWHGKDSACGFNGESYDHSYDECHHPMLLKDAELFAVLRNNAKQLCELALDGLRWREQVNIITNPTLGSDYFKRLFEGHDPKLVDALLNGDWNATEARKLMPAFVQRIEPEFEEVHLPPQRLEEVDPESIPEIARPIKD